VRNHELLWVKFEQIQKKSKKDRIFRFRFLRLSSAKNAENKKLKIPRRKTRTGSIPVTGTTFPP
jgi:hypothetical protein